jgi:hypothetical protein
MKHRCWMFAVVVAACAEPEPAPDSIEDAAPALADAEDYRAPDAARAESGPLTECPVETSLVDGWCVPVLQVPDVVEITVPRYRNGAEPPVIDKDRSLLVVDRTRFEAVQNTFTVGKLLTDRNAFMNAYVVNHDLNDGEITGGRVHTRRSGTFNPFEGGREQVNDHNASPPISKLGSMVTIRNTWNERVLGPVPFGGTGPWEDTGDPHELSDPNGPFRLLAVVNRMDLAGETDGRGEGPDGASLAEDQRKWFGEGRLVFGLTDGGTGAYPMTFILEYRLPALRVVAQTETETTFAVDPACGPGVSTDCYDHTSGPADNAAWLDGRARWARVWRELSAASYTKTQYNARLRDIVRLFARPENLIAMRTGERVRDAPGAPDQSGLVELEYREFYSNGGFGLARRHNRREALFCAGGSALLKDVVLEEYDDALDTPAYDYKLGDQTFDVSDPGDREVQLKELCGETRFGSPDGDGGMSLRPAFARFTPDQRWPAFPRWNARRGDNDDAATNEAYRHTTALNSCSGCHAAETGTPGFHIAPRTANANSAVSPFLDGTDHTVTITIRGVPYDYTYNELARRRALLEAFYDRDDVGHAPGTPTGHEGLLKALLHCTTSPCGAG